jgi:hypothetical protein
MNRPSADRNADDERAIRVRGHFEKSTPVAEATGVLRKFYFNNSMV